MPRLFLGLEIPPDVAQALLKAECSVEGARWQRSEQLHLTLVFLGEVPAERVEQAAATARLVQTAPFDLTVQGLGCFGDPAHPKALWAGVAPEAPVISLHRELADPLVEEGFTIENRSFRPHITLSRFKRGQAASVADLLRVEQSTFFGTIPINAFALFESAPGPQGSIYTVLERFNLQSTG
ncbi:MAG TPA: RNA 2',3'-cyclic phosphodiesterase [Marinobacter sp.]|nr:RNA 2',3'-cyclic phosphodiesterase [Marinobacter sp.]